MQLYFPIKFTNDLVASHSNAYKQINLIKENLFLIYLCQYKMRDVDPMSLVDMYVSIS